MTVRGDRPAVGARITYDIVISNYTDWDISNIVIWDSLPYGVKFISSDTSVSPVIENGVISWDYSTNPATEEPLLLGPSGTNEIHISFTVEITELSPDGEPITNIAAVEYNDPMHPAPGPKHPPVYSELSFYPIGRPVVYPNPFNMNSLPNSLVRFDNIVPGSVIQIYTVSGESVTSIYAASVKAYWNCKNRYNNDVSPGIYYFIINNQADNRNHKGKLFLVKN